jgi:putative transposase
VPYREHLRRLSNVWIPNPLFFLTVGTWRRRRLLHQPAAAETILESWRAAGDVHGWVVGRYVIMPDHVHFIARPCPEAKPLSSFMRDWKKWTTHRIGLFTNAEAPLWQAEFFDHVLRSAASYGEKWAYVQQNPVRAGLVPNADDWPLAGEIEYPSF